MTSQENRTPVIIFTKSYRIQGKILVYPKSRVTDFLLAAKRFIPVTEAEVIDVNNRPIFKSEYLSVHRDNIEIIAPVDLASKI